MLQLHSQTHSNNNKIFRSPQRRHTAFCAECGFHFHSITQFAVRVCVCVTQLRFHEHNEPFYSSVKYRLLSNNTYFIAIFSFIYSLIDLIIFLVQSKFLSIFMKVIRFIWWNVVCLFSLTLLYDSQQSDNKFIWTH